MASRGLLQKHKKFRQNAVKWRYIIFTTHGVIFFQNYNPHTYIIVKILRSGISSKSCFLTIISRDIGKIKKKIIVGRHSSTTFGK